ncbi:hypothetical protein QAD02_018227 [Eretmocerus hayati]|uniref:Uncharacterized protein n=1 Tax=Eretmocerus hayati TaxID=131215 RepID=A0ACC2PFT5_9HYME|nr:hypothetical protein QAD02_018227 [Eretmocerus hayati]
MKPGLIKLSAHTQIVSIINLGLSCLYIILIIIFCCVVNQPISVKSESVSGDGAGGKSAIVDTEYHEDEELLNPGIDDELDEEDEYVELNVTAEKSKYLGSPCDATCNPTLQHVYCNLQTKFCECEKPYPVQLGPTKGCAKPKKLGEQCLYQATCIYSDQHSTCTQIQHHAVCDCELGYHQVPLSRSNKRLFCAADLALTATKLPTLLGVAAGITVFTGAICFTLKLFSRARYTRPRNYANAASAAPILYSTETGIPLTLHGRPSSRSSGRSSGGTLAGYNAVTRKHSYAGYSSTENSQQNQRRGTVVSSSRAGAARAAAILLISGQQQSAHASAPSGSEPVTAAESSNGAKQQHRRALSDVPEVSSDGLGSRRASVASIHSSTSSAKSYSARRLERERNEKEQLSNPVPTPSPRTPHSKDELLPNSKKNAEVTFHEQIATTSGMSNVVPGRRSPTATFTSATINEVASPLFERDLARPCTSSSSGYYSSRVS